MDPWSQLNEWGKTVITLASALLALLVTFIKDIVGEFDSDWSSRGVYAILVLLVVTVMSALLSMAKISNVLRKKHQPVNEKGAILFANVSYIAFGGAILIFALVGFAELATYTPHPNPPSPGG